MIKPLLCSAAAAALLATPAFAQTENPRPLPPPPMQQQGYGAPRDMRSGPQYSTPQEQAETEQLNAQGASGYYASPQVLNGQQPGGLRAAEVQTTREDQEYQDSQQQYRESLEHYREQRQNYSRAQQDYRAAMRRYDRAAWDFDDYPQVMDLSYGSPQLVSLVSLGNANVIGGSPVQGPDGWEGRVIGWGTTENGRNAVEVALNHHFAVYVRPRHLQYDRGAGVMFTDLGKNALWGLPGVYLQSGYYARSDDDGASY